MHGLRNLFLRVFNKLDIDNCLLKLSIEYVKNSIFNCHCMAGVTPTCNCQAKRFVVHPFLQYTNDRNSKNLPDLYYPCYIFESSTE